MKALLDPGKEICLEETSTASAHLGHPNAEENHENSNRCPVKFGQIKVFRRYTNKSKLHSRRNTKNRLILGTLNTIQCMAF
jgi:hypothetical protein